MKPSDLVKLTYHDKAQPYDNRLRKAIGYILNTKYVLHRDRKEYYAYFPIVNRGWWLPGFRLEKINVRLEIINEQRK